MTLGELINALYRMQLQDVGVTSLPVVFHDRDGHYYPVRPAMPPVTYKGDLMPWLTPDENGEVTVVLLLNDLAD